MNCKLITLDNKTLWIIFSNQNGVQFSTWFENPPKSIINFEHIDMENKFNAILNEKEVDFLKIQYDSQIENVFNNPSEQAHLTDSITNEEIKILYDLCHEFFIIKGIDPAYGMKEISSRVSTKGLKSTTYYFKRERILRIFLTNNDGNYKWEIEKYYE